MKRTLFFAFLFFCTAHAHKITLMINPAGDAQKTGRVIDKSFERALTLQMANHLKSYIESHHNNVRVVLTRSAGESVSTLQNASFSNRLDVDFFISIHMFQAPSNKSSSVSIYYFSLEPQSVKWQFKDPELSFIKADKAHLFAAPFTKKIVTTLEQELTHSFGQQCTINGPYGIPFAPLMGISAPAVAFEMNIHSHTNWQSYAPLLESALDKVIENLKQLNPRNKS